MSRLKRTGTDVLGTVAKAEGQKRNREEDKMKSIWEWIKSNLDVDMQLVQENTEASTETRCGETNSNPNRARKSMPRSVG
jgi:hypothetical protein